MNEPANAAVIDRPGDRSNTRTDHDQLAAEVSEYFSKTKTNGPPSTAGHTLEIRSSTILKVLACCILAVLALHLLAMVSTFAFGLDHLKGLVPMFNFENEKNVPTYFSSMQLLFAAVLLGICAIQHKSNDGKYLKHWVGLAIIFVFLSLDEAALIHEKTRTISQAFFGTSGLLYYAWVIPFGAFALAVLATYSRFLLWLPRRTATIFMWSGAVFVAGAIGLELFEGQINEAGGYKSFDYMALVTVEETLELLGIYAFIYGLLDYLAGGGRRVEMSLVK